MWSERERERWASPKRGRHSSAVDSEDAAADLAPTQDQQPCVLIRNARVEMACKYQSCMLLKVRCVRKRHLDFGELRRERRTASHNLLRSEEMSLAMHVFLRHERKVGKIPVTTSNPCCKVIEKSFLEADAVALRSPDLSCRSITDTHGFEITPTGAWVPDNPPYAQQYVGKSQSCMVTSGRVIVHAAVS